MGHKFEGLVPGERIPEEERHFSQGELVTIPLDTNRAYIEMNEAFELKPGESYRVFGVVETEGDDGSLVPMAYIGPADADPELVKRFTTFAEFFENEQYPLGFYPVQELRKTVVH